MSPVPGTQVPKASSSADSNVVLYWNAGISQHNWIEIAKQSEEKYDVPDCAEVTD